MSYTREQWWVAVLAKVGKTNPSQFVKDFGVAWTKYETAGPPHFAAYNLLNTIQDEPGATNFNTFGDHGQYHVKNYPDFASGVKANATALMNGHYPHLLAALRNNDDGALKGPLPEISAELGTWGTGHGPDIAKLAENMSDALRHEQFPGADPAGPPQPVGGQADNDTPAVKAIEDAFTKLVSDIEALKKQVEGALEPGQP